jgi:hypothetical protein
MSIDIYKFTEEYGVGGFLFVAFIILATTIIKTKWFSEWWSKLTDKFIEWFMKRKTKTAHETDLVESDIINHDIFDYIDFWTYSKVPTFTFSTEYRTIVFKKYLSIFLKKYKEGIQKFISKGDYKEMDQSQLWKSLLRMINDIIYTYEKECEESGIPKIVIMKMKARNNDTISLTIDLIENIINSQFYESDKNYLKMYSILNIILSILESTISNSESTCNSINGQLSGLSISDGGKNYREP